MRKNLLIILSIICILGLAGCNKKSMNYIISNEPSITGNIKEVNENSVLIENESGEYVVSLKVENSDGIYSPINDTGQVINIELPLGMLIIGFYVGCGIGIYRKRQLKK